MLYSVIIGLIIIAAILLILVVLVQNPKGGGIAANFSSANNIMGVKRTTDFFEKMTWGLAIAIIVLSISTSAFMTTGASSEDVPESNMQDQIDDAQAAPVNPAGQPGAAQPQGNQQGAQPSGGIQPVEE